MVESGDLNGSQAMVVVVIVPEVMDVVANIAIVAEVE